MLTFIIPPAKEMDLPLEKTNLTFPQVSIPVVDKLTSLSIDELAKAYGITEHRAEREYNRWQAITKKQAFAYPALNLYNGLMYRHLSKEKLSTLSTGVVDKSLFIATSLYGVISAYTPIAPHRLDFQTKVYLDQKQTLKNYWRPIYDAWAESQTTIISCLSSEFEEVFSPRIRAKMIQLEFLEERSGKYKKHATISKKARGAFVSQAILENVTNIEQLKQVSVDNFYFRENLSTDKKLVFVKQVS